MNRKLSWAAALGLMAAVSIAAIGLKAGCRPAATSPADDGPPKRIREPAVAGAFYPSDERALDQAIDHYLARAKAESAGRLRGLVCPHAGYEFSGQTAAFAYKSLIGLDVKTVVILGPSHYADFEGAAVSDTDAYRTPLGLVRLSPKAAKLAGTAPFALEKAARVQRPPWYRQSTKPIPAWGEDTPDTWEHSVEVQVPFLQKVLKDFTIVPAVFSQNVRSADAAKALDAILDDQTIVIASSDLSHYRSYDVAKELDARCVQAICDLKPGDIRDDGACGRLPIMTLMHLAKSRGWRPRLLDYRNSGDVTGDKKAVVGYAAIAFFEPAKAEPAAFSPADRKALLELARRTVTEVVTHDKTPDVDGSAVPKSALESKGCFVTLTRNGELRGCIGSITPRGPLYKLIVQMAKSAATEDPRFPRVRPDELDKIEVEISVLTVPAPLKFSSPEDLLAKLQPHRDGVVLKLGPRSATYLPQVWEQVPDKEMFLDTLAQKAGCPAKAWREPGTEAMTYRAEYFKESEARPATGKDQ